MCKSDLHKVSGDIVQGTMSSAPQIFQPVVNAVGNAAGGILSAAGATVVSSVTGTTVASGISTAAVTGIAVVKTALASIGPIGWIILGAVAIYAVTGDM